MDYSKNDLLLSAHAAQLTQLNGRDFRTPTMLTQLNGRDFRTPTMLTQLNRGDFRTPTEVTFPIIWRLRPGEEGLFEWLRRTPIGAYRYITANAVALYVQTVCS